MNKIFSSEEFLLEISNAKSEKEECKGLYWRGIVNTFMSHKGIIERKSLIFLKRKSCKGCEKCEWIWDSLPDFINNHESFISNIEHGKLYSFEISTSQGFEDLYPSIDDISFVKVKE